MKLRVAALVWLVFIVPAFGQSTIDTSLPAAGLPYSSTPIRDNFQAAADDIDGIYARGILTTAVLGSGTTGAVALGQYLLVTSAATGAKSIAAPACTALLDGYYMGVSDEVGTSGTYNDTITPASGTINGASTYVLNANGTGVVFRCYGAAANWINASNSFVSTLLSGLTIPSPALTGTVTLPSGFIGNGLLYDNAGALGNLATG